MGMNTEGTVDPVMKKPLVTEFSHLSLWGTIWESQYNPLICPFRAGIVN
jgi:hypothetical protein